MTKSGFASTIACASFSIVARPDKVKTEPIPAFLEKPISVVILSPT